MSKKRNAKLYYLLILLLLTALMFSSSTYAWFTSNRVVTVNTINVHVAAAGGIEISADGQNWKAIITPDDITTVHDSSYRTSVNQMPFVLEPVSTGKEIDTNNGFLKMYYGRTSNDDDGEYILTSTRTIEKEGNGEDSEGKFIVFDLFFKVTNDTQVYMTNNSKVTYTDLENGKGIANAARIAFVDEGTLPSGSSVAAIQSLRSGSTASTYIWEPNYDLHTNSGVNNALNVYGVTTTTTNGNRIVYDGVINEISSASNIRLKNAKQSLYPQYFKTVNVDYYTRSDFTDNIPVFVLKGGISKIRIYMWIEGQDVDCENDASYDDISFDLQLTVNPS